MSLNKKSANPKSKVKDDTGKSKGCTGETLLTAETGPGAKKTELKMNRIKPL